MATRLIFVGGFLGAGKTTLLLRAAGLLAKQGHRVGVVMKSRSAAAPTWPRRCSARSSSITPINFSSHR